MARVLIWDLPVRIFHWLLTGALVTAFTVALTVDDDSATFALHYLAGSVAGFLVLLRVVWGVVGSRWARFRDFTFGPGALAGYLRAALFGGDGARYVGHNPATSWAVVAMFVLIGSIVTTGLLMGSGGEAFEEIHEILAWTLAAVVGAHVAGVALHTIRHRENIGAAMVTGQREAEPAQAIASARPLVGVALLAAVGAFAFGVSRGYDAAAGTVTLPLIGTFAVGEGGEGEGGGDRDGAADEGGDRDGASDEGDDDDDADEH